MTEEDVARELAAVRQLGAARWEPVRLYHLEVLAQRASGYQGTVRRLLDAKLTSGLQLLQTRCQAAQAELSQAPTLTVAPTGHAALTALVRHAADQAQAKGVALGGAGSVDTAQAPGQRPVLPAAQYFRNTWSKLSVDKRVSQALARGPQNPGPLNAHTLVLRSLAQLRDLSPDYVNRMTAYVDTLLCLDQWDASKNVPAKTPQTKTPADAAGQAKLKARRAARK